MAKICVLLPCLLFVLSAAFPAENRVAQLLWSGTELFPQAVATNALASEPRGTAEIGEVAMPGIFLHPRNAERAVLRYPALNVALQPGLRAFLLSHVGVAEGFDWKAEQKPDGVRFYVQFGDRDLASACVQESRWVPLAVPLPAQDGAISGVISLATDPGPDGNSSYDWALFGQPLLVALSDEALPPGLIVNGSTGVLVVEKPTGGVIIEGLDAKGNPLEGLQVTVPGVDSLTYGRFDFSASPDCTQWRWRGEGVAWGGSWQPELRIDTVALSRNVVNFPGEALQARVTVRNGGLGALLPVHGAQVALGTQRVEVAQLAPGEAKTVEVRLPAPKAKEASVAAELSWDSPLGRQAAEQTGTIHLWPPLPKLSQERPSRAEVKDLGDYVLLQNSLSRWLINRQVPGLGALVYVWSDGWKPAGSVAPWVQIAESDGAEIAPVFRRLVPRPGSVPTVRAEGSIGGLNCRIEATLGPGHHACLARVSITAASDTAVRAVRGPAVHAGDRAFGSKKSIAMFPGLEYLEGDEPSSSDRDLAPPLNDRRVPHKFKVTMPMMTVQSPDGLVMGVVWDPNQQWDGQRTAPGACFGSPDLITGYDSHLMQLQLPSTPDGIPENKRQAAEPVTLRQGETWTLTQQLLAAQGGKDGSDPLLWYEKLIGYPRAEAWPRGYEEEIALCRHAFMETVWDAEAKKGRHVVGWGSANSPGHATLMLWDARTVARGEEKQRLLERVDLVGNQTIQQEGPGGLASRANCHIMGWEFPYHWGGLPGALDGMRDQAAAAMKSQEADGGWGFYPGEGREKLGAPGTQTMGTCAANAVWLARWAAISGDPAALQAMRKAMDRLRQFPVPRGAQGWECPVLEPDVLASAYGVRAATWAYMATGEQRYLDDARFYARTGLPFQYAWDDGQHPGMRYASIPVFGSTFFTHSWIGLPVQWCGLVYGYGLVELMRFDDDDLWARQVDGMVSSGMHQQWPMDNNELAGTYPDSYGQWFTVRNPVHINPENIQLNLMARRGQDPGLRSVAAKVGGETWHVTAPGEVQVKPAQGRATISVKYLPGEIVYLSIGGLKPSAATSVSAGGEALPQQEDLPHGATGWTGSEDPGMVVVGGRCDEEGRLEVVVGG